MNDRPEPDYTARWRTRLANHASCCGLSPSAVALALVMASRSDGGMVWREGTWEATDKSMAKAMGWGLRAVRKHRTALERSGWWVCERRGSKQGETGVTSRFRLAVPAVCQGCKPVPNRHERATWEEAPTGTAVHPNRHDRVFPTGTNAPPKDQYQLPVEEPVPPPTPSEPERESVGRPPGEEEQQTASRAVMTERVSSPRAIPDALATQRGFTSGEEAARFFAALYPDVREPVAYLRGLGREGRDRWQQQVSGWREEAEQAEREAYVADYDHWRTMAMLGRLPGEARVTEYRLAGAYPKDRERTLATYIALRELGWSAQDLVEQVMAEPVHTHGDDRPSITVWLADLLASDRPTMAEPATTSPPWPPEPWDIAADNGGYTWREQCAPLAEGEF